MSTDPSQSQPPLAPRPAAGIEPPFDFGIYSMSVLGIGFVAAMFYFLAFASFGDEWDFSVAYYSHGGGEINSICTFVSADLDAGYGANLFLWPIIGVLGLFVERFLAGINPMSPRPAQFAAKPV